MIIEQWPIFLFGMCGSWAVEIVNIIASYEREKDLPERYRKFGFWVCRFFLSVFAGGLALAYKIDLPVLAFHIGAATPIIVQQFARTKPQ